MGPVGQHEWGVSTMRLARLVFGLLAAVPLQALMADDSAPHRIDPHTVLETEIKPGETHVYTLAVQAGQSADIAVVQEGVDVVVELDGPDGRMMDVIDSPNGRFGDEPVEIIAKASGDYRLRIYPNADEPVGKYRLEVRAFRDAAATTALLATRQAARQQARNWLLRHAIAIPDSGVLDERAPLARFDTLAGRARVIGLGEATHGSREFADLRLSLTERLVEKHGFRIVALESSAARFRALAPYVAGTKPLDAAYGTLLESRWIGRRSNRALVEWVREWNLHRPGDPVSIIGLDAQDNALSRRTLGAFLAEAYGEEFAKRWKPAAEELNAADVQTEVFGDSNVSAPTRAAVLETAAMLSTDRAMLVQKFGSARVAEATQAAGDLVQFADFNASDGVHARDWYMADNILAALQGGKSRAVFWAHNAHVAHSAPPSRTTGALLRAALGCDYAAVATAFGQGDFVAQLPDDPQDRLVVSTLPAAPAGSIDEVVASDHAALSAWSCHEARTSLPIWLQSAHPLHWIGALYKPGGGQSMAFRPYELTEAFDGIAYFPRVTAEAIPADRPIIPARTPQPAGSK
jgi:erythromycin esterase